MKSATTIDEVIESLTQIINSCEQNGDSLGYFAVLYQAVTIKIRDEIQKESFQDNKRLKKLDVIFANRYIDAYYAYKEGQPITQSWQVAFEMAKKPFPIVLQHLLMGMNAHINLDLGIATAQTVKGIEIENIHEDFNKVNELLFSMVEDVQNSLTKIWKPLGLLLKYTGSLDDAIIGFSIELARNGAWKFAKQVASPIRSQEQDILETTVSTRDHKVAAKASIVSKPWLPIQVLLLIVRLGEFGTTSKRIRKIRKSLHLP